MCIAGIELRTSGLVVKHLCLLSTSLAQGIVIFNRKICPIHVYQLFKYPDLWGREHYTPSCPHPANCYPCLWKKPISYCFCSSPFLHHLLSLPPQCCAMRHSTPTTITTVTAAFCWRPHCLPVWFLCRSFPRTSKHCWPLRRCWIDCQQAIFWMAVLSSLWEREVYAHIHEVSATKGLPMYSVLAVRTRKIVSQLPLLHWLSFCLQCWGLSLGPYTCYVSALSAHPILLFLRYLRTCIPFPAYVPLFFQWNVIESPLCPRIISFLFLLGALSCFSFPDVPVPDSDQNLSGYTNWKRNESDTIVERRMQYTQRMMLPKLSPQCLWSHDYRNNQIQLDGC